MKLIDIGANLPDHVFRGIYHGKTVHSNDMISVLKRSSSVGISGIMSTSTSLADYHENSQIIKEFSSISVPSNSETGVISFPKISTTLGVHPCYSDQVSKMCNRDPKKIDEYFEKMKAVVDSKPDDLVAIGECGVDYARLFRSPKEVQLPFFEKHFDLLHTGLPMFLHMRDCATDFMEIMRRNRDSFTAGVVHSFTGTLEEAKEILEYSENMYIGLNGASFRDPQGIEVAKSLPIDRIMIESDAPYCEMRPSHASAYFLKDFKWPIGRAVDKEKFSESLPVRGRNEPSETRRVLYLLSKLHNISEEELSSIIFDNTIKIFPKCA